MAGKLLGMGGDGNDRKMPGKMQILKMHEKWRLTQKNFLLVTLSEVLSMLLHKKILQCLAVNVHNRIKAYTLTYQGKTL